MAGVAANAPAGTAESLAAADVSTQGTYNTIASVANAVPVIGTIAYGLMKLLQDPIFKMVGPPFGTAESILNPDASVYLTLMRVYPPLIFAGFDVDATSPYDPTAVVHATRFLMLRSGQAGVVEGTPAGSAYLAQVDMREPLTDPVYVAAVHVAWAAGRAQPDPALQDPNLAAASLALLRATAAGATANAVSWFNAPNNKDLNGAINGPAMRANLKQVRTWAGESGPDGLLSSVFGGDLAVSAPATDYAWWGFVVTTVALFGAGGLLVARQHGLKLPAFNLLSPRQRLSPGGQAFERLRDVGVLDHELNYARDGMRPMLYFHKAFSDMKALGVGPTALASSGRYFGRAVQPVEINVMPDGKLHLQDGRHRYTAAKAAGARAILATVRLYDRNANVVTEETLVVPLN